MKEMFRDRIAVVTGGASGIGRALCEGLARRGARVTVADVDHEGARMVAASIEATGGRARAAALDVSDGQAVRAAVDGCVEEFGGIDFFFNNAAICVTGDALDIPVEKWDRLMAVNLGGVIHGTMAAYEAMARLGGGHIVNMASLAGFAPFSINTPYTAAKYAVVGFTHALRPEAADHGVKMTLVCPGIVRTTFYDSIEVVGACREAYNSHLPKRAIDAERAAALILRGVAKNRKMIIFPFHARAFWWVQKLAPWLMDVINRSMVRKFRSMKHA